MQLFQKSHARRKIVNPLYLNILKKDEKMETPVLAKPCGVCVFPRYLKEEVAAFFELRVTNEKSVKSAKSTVFTTVNRTFPVVPLSKN